MAKKTTKTPQERRSDRLRIEMAKKSLKEQIELADLMLKEGYVEEDETAPVIATKDEPTVIEKDMYAYPTMEMPTGPISFDELDAAQAAQERAHEINEASWDAQQLVRNILNHPMLGAKEKATAIKDVGGGFEKRISAILAAPETVQKDLDALSLEAILAHDNRHVSLPRKIGNFLWKATLSTDDQEDLPDSDLALVKEVDGKKVRKYPIHDAAHTRNALARAAQEINVGGQSAIDAKEAMPRIRAAAKKFGIESTMKKDKSAIIIEKDQSGTWRWVGWPSNNFEDVQHDIISKAAHREYVAFLDEFPGMAPAFMSWHTPETVRKSLPDFWAEHEGFLIMSGPLTDGEAEALMKNALVADLGMSHQAFALSRDPQDKRVVTKYRMFEVSDLPLENAANPFTAIEAISKEASMDQAGKLEYLAQYMGKDRATELLAKTSDTSAALTQAGIVSKEATPPVVAPVTVNNVVQAQKADVPEHVVKEIADKLGMKELSDFVVQAQDALEKLPLLEAAVQTLSKSQDVRLAEKISPPASTVFAWMQKERPSESASNVLGEDDKLLKAKPETGWLSEATGTKPIPATQ